MLFEESEPSNIEILKSRIKSIKSQDLSEVYAGGYSALELIVNSEEFLRKLDSQRKFTAKLLLTQLTSYHQTAINEGSCRSLTFGPTLLRKTLLDLIQASVK